jgi:hypothetical protein
MVLDIGQEQERRNVVSSIHTINTRDFDYLPYQSIDQFFQGILPGGLFTSHSGLPGSGGVLNLRGQTSLFANNMPLIIVDGYPLKMVQYILHRLPGEIITRFQLLPLRMCQVFQF